MHPEPIGAIVQLRIANRKNFMPAYIYHILHLAGILLVFLSLGGAIVRSMSSTDDPAIRKMVGISFGLGMLIILVAGFGFLAKSKLGFHPWVFMKIGIWLLIGGLFSVINKKPSLGKTLWFTIFLLGVVAAYLGYRKPFTSYENAPDESPVKQVQASQ
ncbi:MAG: hypothetical protein ACI9TH_001813 [Kiritimatiellia bacterium]|jgi:hypothetical protein